jgi:hypothetical protein
MADQLDGCFVKLARAGAHLDALRTAIEQFFGPDPEHIPGEFDLGSGHYIFRARRAIAVPLEWSAIIGDVVHNVHAALDYLAWELVAANGKTGNTGTGFPIFQDRGEYARGAPRKIAGIHPDAQKLIERLQPFQVSPRDAHPSERPLALLYELERQDKHRALNLTTHVGVVRIHGFPAQIYQPPEPSKFPLKPYEAGEALWRIKGFQDRPRMDLVIEIAHRIAFAVSGPAAARDVLETLATIKWHVENDAIPRFRRFF